MSRWTPRAQPVPRAGWTARAATWLRDTRPGLFAVALAVGAESGLAATAFRYLIYFFTWLVTGHVQFGQQGRVPSGHLPWLGVGFLVVIPVIGGLVYGPLIYRYAREARGHGVPEVMIAVAESGGRIRPQVSVVKALASALCIGAGGSVGREGPIVQIGSALASSLGQRARMPESRLRILVACGAAGGIAATFNAPITGVFFGVEIILRAFSVEAIFTVMLSAMVADVISQAVTGSAPFLSGFPAGIALHHPSSYLLVALLAVLAALIGLAFKTVLYKTEDVCDRVWGHRPEWARPAVGGVALGVLLLAIPQLYGVGYPVMYRAVGGGNALWFLIVLAAAKMVAASLTIGIGGSGGVFAPSLFIGATSGMAFGEIAGHVFGPAAGQPALYAVVAMGAVFTSAARAPLTSLASVVEMTGDFSLTLPVMLAVAIATAVSRGLSYGTIYTTKLLRRGTDIDRPTPSGLFQDLTVRDAMRPLQPAVVPAPGSTPARPRTPPPGPVLRKAAPPALLSGESLEHALRQLAAGGTDGLPVVAADGQHPQGWITTWDVLRALATRVIAAEASDPRNPDGGSPGDHGTGETRDDLAALPGYEILEVTIGPSSAAAGRALGEASWPPGAVPLAVQDARGTRDAYPGITLRPGDRISLLAPRPSPRPSPRARLRLTAEGAGELCLAHRGTAFDVPPPCLGLQLRLRGTRRPGLRALPATTGRGHVSNGRPARSPRLTRPGPLLADRPGRDLRRSRSERGSGRPPAGQLARLPGG